MKQPRELLGEHALTPHARPEARIVELAAAQRTDPLEHLLLPTRFVAAQPILEQGRHRQRQSQHFLARPTRPGDYQDI